MSTCIHRATILATCALALLGACGGDDDGGGGNPARLYLAPRGSETSVQLVGEEPSPF
jgi:hypothetical protein